MQQSKQAETSRDKSGSSLSCLSAEQSLVITKQFEGSHKEKVLWRICGSCCLLRTSGKARGLGMECIFSPQNAFMGAGEENGCAPIRTVKYFHFPPLKKALWQRCHVNVNGKQSYDRHRPIRGCDCLWERGFQFVTPHFAWRRLKGTRQSRAAGGAPGARPQTLLFTNVGCVKTKAHPH